MIKAFDKRNLNDLRIALDAALASVAKQYGIQIKAGSARYTADTATFKVELATVSGDGTVMTKEASDFKQSCGLYGLKPEHLGATVYIRGEAYKISGLTGGRSWKFPIAAKRVSDGKSFKLPESAVASLKDKNAVPTPTVVDFVPPNHVLAGICENTNAIDFTVSPAKFGKCERKANTVRKVGFGRSAKMIKVCTDCARLMDDAKAEMAAEAAGS